MIELFKNNDFDLSSLQQSDNEIEPKPIHSNHNGCELYFAKWTGKHQMSPEMAKMEEVAISAVGSLFGMSSLTLLHYHVVSVMGHGYSFSIASFGASVVLLFAAPSGPLSQPRNLVLGHFASAIVGVSIKNIITDFPSISIPIAVSLSIFVMHMTKSLHPPGGGTAYVICSLSSLPVDGIAGFSYVFLPVLAASLLLLLFSLLINNMANNRHYPNHWT